MEDMARALLSEAYDLHVHTSPSHFDRRQDDFELMNSMDQWGMAGAVIKVHYGATESRALIANKYSGTKSKLYGAVTLDWPAGGLNPYAVECELLLGAKMVWLPTFHAKNHIEKARNADKQPIVAPGISVLDDRGRLVPNVYEIIDLVVQYDAVLNTGHISAAESYCLCKEARKRKAKVTLTHPDNAREAVPVEMQSELAKLGVFIDRSWFNIVKGAVTPEEMARRICLISASSCIMTTDFGQTANVPAPEGMQMFIQCMLEQGVTPEEITTMVKQNPKMLLDIK